MVEAPGQRGKPAVLDVVEFHQPAHDTRTLPPRRRRTRGRMPAMAADARGGRRDEKGHWRPAEPCSYAPLFSRPWRPGKVIAWILRWGGYLIPKHVLYAGLAFLTWRFLQADLAVTQSWAVGWPLAMLARNAALMLLVYGFYHTMLYVWRVDGDSGKYHPQWQQKGVRKFLFDDQVKDNVFWSLVSGVPVWTAWEALYLWLAGNGWVATITWSSNSVWFIALFLLIPLWRDTHFYFTHRLLHWKPLLRAVHSVHHKNPSPIPWTGMAMHPVEHLLYLSVLVIFFVVPAHPIHVLFTMQLTALTPAQSHTGFEGPVFRGVWPASNCFHYLHHKHVSCNYGFPLIPWDRWLGRFYDGEGPYRTRP